MEFNKAYGAGNWLKKVDATLVQMVASIENENCSK